MLKKHYSSVKSKEPVHTEEPAQTKEPVQAAEPAQTKEPVHTEEPAQTKEPVHTEEPSQTEEHVAISYATVLVNADTARDDEVTKVDSSFKGEEIPDTTSESSRSTQIYSPTINSDEYKHAVSKAYARAFAEEYEVSQDYQKAGIFADAYISMWTRT